MHDTDNNTQPDDSRSDVNAEILAAVREGLADVEAGRYVDFDTPQSLSQYLKVLTAKAIKSA
jgi:predicted transcriptional regulator